MLRRLQCAAAALAAVFLASAAIGLGEVAKAVLRYAWAQVAWVGWIGQFSDNAAVPISAWVAWLELSLLAAGIIKWKQCWTVQWNFIAAQQKHSWRLLWFAPVPRYIVQSARFEPTLALANYLVSMTLFVVLGHESCAVIGIGLLLAGLLLALVGALVVVTVFASHWVNVRQCAVLGGMMAYLVVVVDVCIDSHIPFTTSLVLMLLAHPLPVLLFMVVLAGPLIAAVALQLPVHLLVVGAPTGAAMALFIAKFFVPLGVHLQPTTMLCGFEVAFDVLGLLLLPQVVCWVVHELSVCAQGVRWCVSSELQTDWGSADFKLDTLMNSTSIAPPSSPALAVAFAATVAVHMGGHGVPATATVAIHRKRSTAGSWPAVCEPLSMSFVAYTSDATCKCDYPWLCRLCPQAWCCRRPLLQVDGTVRVETDADSNCVLHVDAAILIGMRSLRVNWKRLECSISVRSSCGLVFAVPVIAPVDGTPTYLLTSASDLVIPDIGDLSRAFDTQRIPARYQYGPEWLRLNRACASIVEWLHADATGDKTCLSPVQLKQIAHHQFDTAIHAKIAHEARYIMETSWLWAVQCSLPIPVQEAYSLFHGACLCYLRYGMSNKRCLSTGSAIRSSLAALRSVLSFISANERLVAAACKPCESLVEWAQNVQAAVRSSEAAAEGSGESPPEIVAGTAVRYDGFHPGNPHLVLEH